jgi:hypothetical protein
VMCNWQELMMGLGGQKNSLFINDGTGRFTDRASELLPDDKCAGRGGDIGDVNKDGYPDIVFACLGGIGLPGTGKGTPNRLYLNQGNGTGRFVDGSRVLPVAPEHGITFSDRDIAEIAQAKGSNFAAQMILMKLFGIGPDDIGTLYLAGGFAEYLDVAQASRIGMIAPVPEDRVVKLGNASLQGARALLCDESLRRELEEFTPQIEHVRLELDPDFFNLYVGGMGFHVEPLAKT